MHVLGDFLKRRIAPLQQRPRPVWIYTGPNDCGRVESGVDTDLTREALEIMVQGVTSENFVLELLVLPARIVPLYEDQQLRTRVLRSMPTLDDGGLAARQPSGDPNRGIQIPGVQESQSRPTAVATSAAAAGANIPATSSNASNRGKQVVSDGPVPGGSSSRPSGEEERRRLRRIDGTFVGEPSTKRQRTVEAAGQGSSRTPSSHGSSVAPVPPPPPPGRSPPAVAAGTGRLSAAAVATAGAATAADSVTTAVADGITATNSATNTPTTTTAAGTAAADGVFVAAVAATPAAGLCPAATARCGASAKLPSLLMNIKEWDLDLAANICSDLGVCSIVPWRPVPLGGRLKLLRLATTKLVLHTTQGRFLVACRGIPWGQPLGLSQPIL